MFFKATKRAVEVAAVGGGGVGQRLQALEELVAAPGAVYVPGGATTRSLRALEPSLILAVLCKGASQDSPVAAA